MDYVKIKVTPKWEFILLCIETGKMSRLRKFYKEVGRIPPGWAAGPPVYVWRRTKRCDDVK